MRRSAIAGLVAAAVLGASCSGDAGPPAPSRPSKEADRPRCDVAPGEVPEGFLLRRQRDRPHRDHVGVHRVFVAPDGRRLDYLLGVIGEVGEGLPLAGSVELGSGQPARLAGRGKTWTLVWVQNPPCRQGAVVAAGMGRRELLRILRRAGLLAAG